MKNIISRSQRILVVYLVHGSLTQAAKAPLMKVKDAAARAGVKPATVADIIRKWRKACYNIDYLSKKKEGQKI